MSKTEFVSPEGFRIDGRRPSEIRTFRCQVGGVSQNADGSAYVEMGCTKALAYVYGPKEARRGAMKTQCGVLTCEVSLAPFSTADRRKRSRYDRQTVELALTIRQAFESSILLELYQRAQIDMFVHILETDGGHKAAAINACNLALIDAGINIRDSLVACSAGYIDGRPIVDMNQAEINAGGVELLLGVFARTRKVSVIEMDSKITPEVFQETYEACIAACRDLYTAMETAVNDTALRLVHSK
ncbi:unnamed protein product [Vitrella brassicaformis CCMP3155]|uniref:Uncharacterized protein n=1 Tax=Vitrella brassicaformis (strain CCMP3155) TaxID=1169540 RepID=A0A0G4FR10_VITBC|nr:unnamed protein product [Vitrella brassicaformis CCMP3155]|mmetsp:Transcript_45220/g.112329  ORF Transcript_45220/g.112329 Transcript_45220/m.112329 type:complete len:243 (-) Transcript_45220:286-1014(-)|eukprot:CEM16888.1 unnamed protein product [Vitrella brassicaformis CCMP3155]